MIEVVKIFESWADNLPDPLFNRVVIQPTKRIIENIRSRGYTTPIIGFARMSGTNSIKYAEQTGIDCLALDQGVDPVWANQHIPSKIAVQGHLDPAVLYAGGRELDQEIDRLLDVWSSRPFIFNLGHGINLQTPPENVARLVAHVRKRKS